MNYQALEILFVNGVRGLLFILFAVMATYLIIGMAWQMATGLWQRRKARRQYPFELVADDRYRPMAEVRTVEGKQPGDEFRPLYVKAGNK